MGLFEDQRTADFAKPQPVGLVHLHLCLYTFRPVSEMIVTHSPDLGLTMLQDEWELRFTDSTSIFRAPTMCRYGAKGWMDYKGNRVADLIW